MRDKNILLSYKREINLNSRITKKRNKYIRKIKHKGKIMKRYFIEPGKTAIVIITNYIKEVRYVAKELGLIEVSFTVWRSFNLNHENKVLVL